MAEYCVIRKLDEDKLFGKDGLESNLELRIISLRYTKSPGAIKRGIPRLNMNDRKESQ